VLISEVGAADELIVGSGKTKEQIDEARDGIMNVNSNHGR